VALFVLILVAVVVGQTWLDWRDERKAWVVPEWAKGVALGGAIGVLLATAATFATVWMRDEAGQWSDALGSRLFWPELVFLLGSLGIIVYAARKKRLRFVALLAALLIAAFWLGMAFGR
jgi:hypothetical protein